jgi:hypothetical protein
MATGAAARHSSVHPRKVRLRPGWQPRSQHVRFGQQPVAQPYHRCMWPRAIRFSACWYTTQVTLSVNRFPRTACHHHVRPSSASSRLTWLPHSLHRRPLTNQFRRWDSGERGRKLDISFRDRHAQGRSIQEDEEDADVEEEDYLRESTETEMAKAVILDNRIATQTGKQTITGTTTYSQITTMHWLALAERLLRPSSGLLLRRVGGETEVRLHMISDELSFTIRIP